MSVCNQCDEDVAEFNFNGELTICVFCEDRSTCRQCREYSSSGWCPNCEEDPVVHYFRLALKNR